MASHPGLPPIAGHLLKPVESAYHRRSAGASRSGRWSASGRRTATSPATSPGRPKGPDSGAEVSLGVTWGVPRGALDIVAGQTPPHFFRGAGIAPGGPGRLGHETRQGSLHVALKSVVVRPELGDLNVIIQVEEWHSSDRFGGTVRARESGHLACSNIDLGSEGSGCDRLLCRFVSGSIRLPGDLNVIIQVEEWHSSDRLHGTVRAPRSAQIRALKCR